MTTTLTAPTGAAAGIGLAELAGKLSTGSAVHPALQRHLTPRVDGEAHAFNSAITNPAFNSAITNPAFNSAITNPAFNSAIANPAFNSAITNPAFNSAITNPAFNSAITNEDHASNSSLSSNL
ncbi:hypothetical protein [Nocardia sp. NPDC051463]|uniref:hypothetical protein n=1 Tax=Nocardia sp. NPDC051463 TaxID=3154845 RepID=UPI003415D59F